MNGMVDKTAFGRTLDRLWHALVELQEETAESKTAWEPKVYIVQSLRVARMVTADYSRWACLRHELWPAREERRTGMVVSVGTRIHWSGFSRSQSNPQTPGESLWRQPVAPSNIALTSDH